MVQQPVLPDYQGACTANVIPEVIKHLMKRPVEAWMPAPLSQAKQVVVVVIDGLGWNQLIAKAALTPTLAEFSGRAITTVAPTTTATALTSIITGRPPSVHGIIGYRLVVGGERVLNVLKWTVDEHDARSAVPPSAFQRQPAFAGNTVPVVTRKYFKNTGFTDAHLAGADLHGYTSVSALPLEVWRLAKEGAPLIYAYYDGLDQVAHAHGLGDHYDAELYNVDRMVRDLMSGLPEGTAVILTADHGQVETGDNIVRVADEVHAQVRLYSGEARFFWLHAHAGGAGRLLEAARRHHSDVAWVMTREELSRSGVWGGLISDELAARVGDVALIPFAPVAFVAGDHSGENHLRCRHGSLTADEMLVPLLARLV